MINTSIAQRYIFPLSRLRESVRREGNGQDYFMEDHDYHAR